MYSVYAHSYLLAGFCPHWLEVVGPIHHSVVFFTTTHKSKNIEKLQQMYFYCILAKSLALGKPPLRQFWTEPCIGLMHTHM